MPPCAAPIAIPLPSMRRSLSFAVIAATATPACDISAEDRVAAHHLGVGHHDLGAAVAVEREIARDAVHRRRRAGHDRQIVRVREARHRRVGERVEPLPPPRARLSAIRRPQAPPRYRPDRTHRRRSRLSVVMAGGKFGHSARSVPSVYSGQPASRRPAGKMPALLTSLRKSRPIGARPVRSPRRWRTRPLRASGCRRAPRRGRRCGAARRSDRGAGRSP